MTLPLLIVSSFYPSWFFGVPLLSEDLEDFKSGSSTSVLIASNKSADLGLRPNCIPRALVDGAGGVEERLQRWSVTIQIDLPSFFLLPDVRCSFQ